MALSYEFSIGSVRAREKHLLNSADIERLTACKSSSELCSVLSDKGYGSEKTVDGLLDERTAQMWSYLRSTAPDFELFSVFLIQNDVHNLKVVLKGTMSQREYTSLLLEPGTIDRGTIIKAVENRRMNYLPAWLQKPADRAYEALAHTSDARLCDAYLDGALMERLLELSKNWNSDFLAAYFNNLVFYNNIKTAVRSARTGANKEYLKIALCEAEGFRKQDVINAAVKGLDPLIDFLSKYRDYDCDKAIDRYKSSPAEFEKFVDDRLICLACECCKRASEGAEPLLGYYLGCEAEKKVIHIIDSGIRTGAEPEAIRERLREIYG